jgi:hypothetical protein
MRSLLPFYGRSTGSIGALVVNEKSSLDRSLERPPSASPSERLEEADHVTSRSISTMDLLAPIFMRTFYRGALAPLLFACIGSSSILAPFRDLSQRLINSMAPFWPSVPAQYKLVLEVRGPGHAASYGFMCAALWAWPIICAIGFLTTHAKRRKEILPILPKEIGQFIVMFPFALLPLALGRTTTDGPFGFYADRWGFFYFQQWFVFSLTAFVLGTLLYVLGRIILQRTWLRAD